MDDAEDCSKVVLSDFGLSKFATPEEIMGVACGTLSYVAPEVLRLNGYTKAVDYWSIGIIMYLLLSGYLPFSGKTQKDTISLTIKCDLKFTKESWNSRSEESKDLLRHLLRSDPNRRASGEKIIQHSWFDEIRSEMVDEDTVDECNELPTMSSVGARRSLDLSVSHGSLDPSGNQSTSEDEHDNVVQH